MRSNLFESELERVARTLTDQFGVQVVCQGDEAWTDGKQIVLPSLPEPMNEPLERMVVGYLDHEMAHVAFSDFQVVKEFSEKHPGFEALLNVVEDAYIERRAMQRWPGVRANLDAMFAQIRGRVAALASQRDAFGRFCTAVYLKLAHYGDMLGLEAGVAGYEDLLDGFASVRRTSDSAVLAERLLERWIQRHPQRSPAPEAQPDGGDEGEHAEGVDGQSSDTAGSRGASTSGTSDAPSEPPVGEDDAEPTGSNNAEGSEAPVSSEVSTSPAADSDAESGRPGGDEDDGPDRSDGTTGADGDAQDDDDTAGPSPIPNGSGGEDSTTGVASPHGAGGVSLITEALTGAIAEQAAQVDARGEYRAYTKQFDRVAVVSEADDAAVTELLARHGGIVRRLRRGLANPLRSAEKRWWRDDQLRGDLSARCLHRLCLDRPQLDVFRTRASVQGQSTAVSLLLDASGSMTINKMDVARDALRVLLQALAELKVASEAVTFTTGNDASVFQQAALQGADPNELRRRYSRIAHLEIGLVKQFEEPVKAALRRLPTIKGTGLTPLGEAMQIAARRLAPRRETRRILLVLTDGRAGCEGNDGSAVAHAQYVARQIQAAGIELIGVGILDESLRAIVADTIVVHQLEELPAQLYKLLGRTLKKGLRHVG